MSNQQLLDQIKALGLEIKEKSEPNYWPVHQRSYAKTYQDWLQAMRTLYSEVNSGKDVAAAFSKAKTVINTGIETNKLSRILRDNS